MKIAVYLNRLDQEYQIEFYKSLHKRAMELGINTICLQQQTYRPSNENFTFLPASKFVKADGVVILSSALTNQEQVLNATFLNECFGTVPIIAAGIPVPGIPSVVIDAKNTMRELMEHLIYTHRFKSFLYVGGSKKHRDSILRENIFRQTLDEAKDKGIPVQYSSIYTEFTEYTAMRSLGDWIKRNPKNIPQAIVCASDMVALGVRQVIKTQDNPDWQDIAITGFDNIAKASGEELTTICQPIDELGRLAAENIYTLLTNGKIELLSKIQSSLIIRESCGCKKHCEQEKKESDYERGKREQVEQYVNHFGPEVNQAENLEKIADLLNEFLAGAGIQYFYLLLFSDAKMEAQGRAYLVYEKTPENEEYNALAKIVDLPDFFGSYRFSMNYDDGSDLVYKLMSGNRELGLMIYKTRFPIYAQMCNCGLFLASALQRLRNLGDEKRRNLWLESEVEKRTQDLVNANRALAEESERRIQVEAQVLKVSELERQRFSMDLHDDICQRLAGISMLAKGLSANNKSLEELSALIDETLRRTRQYAHEAFPVELESLGLEKALGSLCEAVQRESYGKFQVNFVWNAMVTDFADGVKTINIFRIIQEALHNAVKHSKADTITVSLQEDSLALKVSVEDNGTGFLSHGDKKKGSGMGLLSMKYRADQIGATFSIEPKTEGGTRVLLVLPVQKIKTVYR